MVHVPAALRVRTIPETVQTASVLVDTVKEVSPVEVVDPGMTEVAMIVYGDCPMVRELGAVVEIV